MQLIRCDGCKAEAPAQKYQAVPEGWARVVITTSGSNFHSTQNKDNCAKCLKKLGIEIPVKTDADRKTAQEKLVDAVQALIQEEVEGAMEDQGCP